MSSSIIPAGAGLIEEVARRLERSGVAPAEAVVVFPGRRPAHFLRQRLAEGTGASFIPPRILSMDELIDAVYEGTAARSGHVRPKLEPIDAVALLYEIQLEAARPLGGKAFMTLDGFFPLGMKIHGDIEELFIEEISARKVADFQALVEEEVPQRSRERLQSLALFYEKFYPAAEAAGFSTRSSRYRAVSEAIEPADIAATGPIVFAGFFALTRAERRLFNSVAGWPRVQFLFQSGPGLQKMIEGLGVTGFSESPQPQPEVHFYSSPDTHGQVFALGAALGAADGKSLIVLPEPETLFPLLRHCLSRLDPESYNVSLGYPLPRTPLYGFLNSLLELVGSMDGELVYVPDYVSFVLHPYVKNMRLGGSAEASRVLFHALEEHLAEKRTRRFVSLTDIEAAQELFDEAARRLGEENPGEMAARLRRHLAGIHARTVGRFRSFRDVRDFAKRCIELIAWVHEESTARDHPYFTPFSESFVQSLETIERSLLASKSFNDAGSYFMLLRRFLQTCYHPFQGTPLHGLQVLGALETRGLAFDRVFVLDANEGTFPETGGESTLLPHAVRLALGLSTARDQEDVAAYHFNALAAGARELHLFSVDAGDKERSRFIERLLWERQKAAKSLGDSSLVQSIQYRVTLSTKAPSPVEKTPEAAAWLATRSYSATALDAYLRCPLEFYHRYVLNLGQRAEPSGEIEARDIGSFVHDVLSRYFSTRTGRPLVAEDIDPTAMAALVDARFAEWFGSADAGANRLLREQVKRHLFDFIDSYMRAVTTGHRVIMEALEHSIAAEWKGFALTGRLDAVQERDGKEILIDYKTSSRRGSYALKLKKLALEDRATWSVAVSTLQLPLYMLLRSAETGRGPLEIKAMFLLLGRTAMDEKIEVSLFEDDAEARAGWPLLEQVILGLLKEIVSADVPFTPAQDLTSACPRCDFVGICGTAWLKGR